MYDKDGRIKEQTKLQNEEESNSSCKQALQCFLTSNKLSSMTKSYKIPQNQVKS